MATIYVAGRLWQDAETRLHLVEELDKRTGQVNVPSRTHCNQYLHSDMKAVAEQEDPLSET
ncbi:beta-1,3-galactosyltransferase [Salix suchowensis]|nr:beta-1,3-galactosyltransferase [Salix suchowensis]